MTVPALDPGDPYPLLPSITDAESMEYSAVVDRWLGFDLPGTEARVRERLGTSRMGDPQEFWVGLNIQSLLTPYLEIRQLLERLRPAPGSRVVDLGAAYGRIGFVLGRCHPEVEFIGYEYVRERVAEARRCLSRWDYPKVRMEEADLSAPSFAPEAADFYFIYDYGTRPAVEKTLEDLKTIARSQPITVIGRGRLSRDAIERLHPWLSQVARPEHFRNYSIYRSG